jgi:chromosome segregation ATPase
MSKNIFSPPPMNAINAEAERAFEKLGLKCYATPEEIDQKFRRIMLKVHPDKSGRDSGREAQEYNDLRALAQKIARDPAHHLYREKARQYDETIRYKEKIEIRLHMVAILQDQIHKLSCEHEPDRYEYNPAEFQKKTRDWTPQQRQDAEDAIQYGFERHQLDKALAELESMQTENARLRASLSPSIGKAMIDTAEAKLAEETKRADGLIAAAAEGMQRASAEGERANAEGERADAATKALEEERRRADAAEAELAQCKQRISEVEKCLAEADKKASEWEQRFIAACKDDGAMCEKLQQANEQKILLEQKLTDAGQSVEAAEAKANEWENKCSVLQESLEHELQRQRETMQQSHAQETETETESITKRKRIKLNDNEKETFKSKIDHFVQHSIRSLHGSFTSTDSIVQAFTTNGNKMISAQLFYKTLAASLKRVHPNARHKKSEHAHGYTGISLEDS